MKKELFDKLVDSLQNDEDSWVEETYTWRHKKTGLELWDNGLEFISIYSPDRVDCFGLFQKWKLSRIFKKMKPEKKEQRNKAAMIGIEKLINKL